MKSGLCGSLAVLTLGAHVAHAQPSWFSEDPEEPLKTASITISPYHLRYPIIELTGEFRVGRKLGLAAIVGGGEYTYDDGVTGRVYELGASARYYVVGSFRHGIQIGAELLYVTERAQNTAYVATRSGVGISPLVGYKWTHRTGFTVDMQGGVTYIALREHDEDEDTGYLVNLNIGWSI